VGASTESARSYTKMVRGGEPAPAAQATSTTATSIPGAGSASTTCSGGDPTPPQSIG